MDKELILLMKYVKHIRDNFSITNVLRPFRFYTFDYFFDRKKRPYTEIRFWDKLPLVFVFNITRSKDSINFTGINFHHIPIKSRQIWLARINKVMKTKFENDKMLIMTYSRLWKLFLKATVYATRQYKLDRVHKMRYIPNTQMPEMMRYYANTYYGATYQQIISKYKKYRPKKPK